MLAKAPTLPADEVFLDLEDAVAPLAKAGARANVVAALNDGGWSGQTRAVRVNDVTTPWTYRDVIDVVEGAGDQLDCLVLPKVESAVHVQWLDLLLRPGRGVARSAGGRDRDRGRRSRARAAWRRSTAIAVDPAHASRRSSSVRPTSSRASTCARWSVGEQPRGYDIGDAYHYVLFKILVAARANDLQAIDGPYLAVHDLDGFRRVAGRAAALGLRRQVGDPPGTDRHGERGLRSRPRTTLTTPSSCSRRTTTGPRRSGGMRGAAMLGDEMIDEASRKMALVVSAKGRAAGLVRTSTFEPPS